MGGDTPLGGLIWSDLAPRPGWEQMALDQTMLERAALDGTALLRLYRWSRDTISFGMNEPALRHWDRARLLDGGPPLVRRPTGGRAVWHAASDLTYAWTAPAHRIGTARETYHLVHRTLASALRRLGVPAELAPDPARLPGLRRGACFENAVGGEVIVQGVKVIGSAQLVSGGGLLQHGEISLGDRLAPLAVFRAGEASAPAAGQWPSLPGPEAIADAIAAEWLAGGAEPAAQELTTWAERTSVQHAERYRDPAWTWRR
ncbi:MAG: hypothetical protein V4503_08620 [Gemmatimonadota bacterium]